ncbi:MAG TPA: hypothetical protein QGF58_22510 [Myxococcota bacterium]|nr:hypothetical protein [Myxococcota bacterium]
MSAWQVKTEAGNRKVEDIEALRALVVTGDVLADTKVRKGTRGRWRLAGDVPELVDCFPTDADDEDDPWAAWDDELDEDVRDEVTSGADETEEVPDSTVDDDSSIEVSVDDLVAERPKLTGDKKKKAAKPPEVGDRKEPRVVVDSKAEAPQEKAPPPPERGMVIDFPEGGRRRTRPVRTSAQPAARHDAAAEPRRRPQPSPLDSIRGRYFGYLFFVAVACLGVGIGVWYIWSVATWSSSDPLGHSLGREAPKTVAETVVEPVVPFEEPAEEGDALQPVLESLKAEMVHEIAELPPNDITSLEDATFFELMKLVNVKEQDIEVLTWGPDGMPEQVAFEVKLRTAGDPQRELGAVALVYGKYVDHYEFIVRGFNVTRVDEAAGTAGTYTIDPDKAVSLYRDEIGLMEALSD